MTIEFKEVVRPWEQLRADASSELLYGRLLALSRFQTLDNRLRGDTIAADGSLGGVLSHQDLLLGRTHALKFSRRQAETWLETGKE